MKYFEKKNFIISMGGIRYMDDIILDKRENYKLGFTINLLPGIRINNTVGSTTLRLSWLLWEISFRYVKTFTIEYDVQGRVIKKRKGLRDICNLNHCFAAMRRVCRF